MADIGTDHGLLPIYLIENGISPTCIASDIGEGPAAAARRNVDAAGVAHLVSVRVGDGLQTLQENEVDDVVIAGMGGETIAAILDAAAWVQNPQYRLILQPMSHAEILREWLHTHGFSTVCERLLTDAGRAYILLVASYDGAPPPADEFDYWRGTFSASEGRPYWQKTANYLEQRATGCDSRGEITDAQKWRTFAAKLRDL